MPARHPDRTDEDERVLELERACLRQLGSIWSAVQRTAYRATAPITGSVMQARGGGPAAECSVHEACVSWLDETRSRLARIRSSAP